MCKRKIENYTLIKLFKIIFTAMSIINEFTKINHFIQLVDITKLNKDMKVNS